MSQQRQVLLTITVTRGGSAHSGEPVSADTEPPCRSLRNKLISVFRSLTAQEGKEIKMVTKR